MRSRNLQLNSLYLPCELLVGLKRERTVGWLETVMEQNKVTVGDGYKVVIVKNGYETGTTERNGWMENYDGWMTTANE